MSASLSSTSSIRTRLLPQSPRTTMASVNGGTPRSPSSSSSARRRPILSAALAAADAAFWYCALLFLALMLLSSLREGGGGDQGGGILSLSSDGHLVAGGRSHTGASGRPCDEIYVVREGETLHTISDKCNDPFIIERNPHIHDPDDVFPGLVIRIVPSAPQQ